MKKLTFKEIQEKNRKTREKMSHKTPKIPPGERNDRVGKLKKRIKRLFKDFS